MRIPLSSCECTEPPCRCVSEFRDVTCDHIIRYGDEPCGKEATLRDDCHYFFSAKRVLCDEHYERHRDAVNRKCGVCGVPKTECCC